MYSEPPPPEDQLRIKTTLENKAASQSQVMSGMRPPQD